MCPAFSANLLPSSSETSALDAWLDALNARLRRHLKRDARNLQIGHAYLLPPQPITSMAEFARVLRDDIIPLIEEYCYDDFNTLIEILGSELVDVENGRISDKLFLPSGEHALIQALSFEEMQPIVLDRGLASGGLAVETADEADDGAQAATRRCCVLTTPGSC
jgi:5-methylcytosine-specific restriction enzyme B